MAPIDERNSPGDFHRCLFEGMCPHGGRRGFTLHRECEESGVWICCGEVRNGFVMQFCSDESRVRRLRQFCARPTFGDAFDELMARLHGLSLEKVQSRYFADVLGGEYYTLRILDEAGDVRLAFHQPRDRPELVPVVDGLDDVIEAVAKLFEDERRSSPVWSVLKGLFHDRKASQQTLPSNADYCWPHLGENFSMRRSEDRLFLEGAVRYVLDRMCRCRRGFALVRIRGEAVVRVECGSGRDRWLRFSENGREKCPYIKKAPFEELMGRLRRLDLNRVGSAHPSDVLEGEVYFVRVREEEGEVRSVLWAPREKPELVPVADALDDFIEVASRFAASGRRAPRILEMLEGLFHTHETLDDML